MDKRIIKKYGIEIKRIRLDNSEKSLQKECDKQNLSVIFEFTEPGTPQQNSVVKRRIPTLVGRARAMHPMRRKGIGLVLLKTLEIDLPGRSSLLIQTWLSPVLPSEVPSEHAPTIDLIHLQGRTRNFLSSHHNPHHNPYHTMIL